MIPLSHDNVSFEIVNFSYVFWLSFLQDLHKNFICPRTKNRLAHCLPSRVKWNDKTWDHSYCSCLFFDNKGPYFEVYHLLSLLLFSQVREPFAEWSLLASPILKSYISLNSRVYRFGRSFVKRDAFPFQKTGDTEDFLQGKRLRRNAHSEWEKKARVFWKDSKVRRKWGGSYIYTEQPEMEFNYYLVNLIRVKSVKPTHISGMKYLVWLRILTKSIEIGANSPFYCVVCWHRCIPFVQKNRYLSTNLAVRLSPGFSLAASGMLIHTQDVRKDWNFKFEKRRTWLTGSLVPEFTKRDVPSVKI